MLHVKGHIKIKESNLYRISSARATSAVRKPRHAWDFGPAEGWTQELDVGKYTCSPIEHQPPLEVIHWTKLLRKIRSQPPDNTWKRPILMSFQGQLPLVVMIYKRELSPQHCPLHLPWCGEILLNTSKSTNIFHQVHKLCEQAWGGNPPTQPFAWLHKPKGL